MKLKLLIVLLLGGMFLNAQDTLSLQECIDDVIQNAPRLRDKQLLDQEGQLTAENLKSNWLPSMTINGNVSYKSDVVSLDMGPSSPFTLPEMPHEQYALNLDLQQTIYDGGFTRQQKILEESKTASSMQAVEVDLYSLKEQISGLYFSILLLQENRGNLSIALENLKAREVLVLSAVENGIAMENDLQIIRVEILKILQAISELDAGKRGAIEMLSTYMGREIDEEVLFDVPYLELSDAAEYLRPELEWFDLQSSVIEAGKELTSVKRKPKVYAYGQAGAGMPGYNMLSDEFDTYFMVGAGVSWKIWDWSNTKREKQIMEVKQEVIANSKETYQMNLTARTAKELEQMEHYRKALDLDETMLKMRMDITKHSGKQLENGVISATDYLFVLNEESALRVQKSTHRLQMLKSIVNYNLLKGTL